MDKKVNKDQIDIKDPTPNQGTTSTSNSSGDTKPGGPKSNKPVGKS
ncbi:MAG: hypothetical protein R8G66_04730 [Cytophagales bacterium]|nr:hypothetical protein [Cytophagales bacterium]